MLGHMSLPPRPRSNAPIDSAPNAARDGSCGWDDGLTCGARLPWAARRNAFILAPADRRREAYDAQRICGILGQTRPQLGPLPCAGILAKSLLAAQPRFAAAARVVGSAKTPNAASSGLRRRSAWMRPVDHNLGGAPRSVGKPLPVAAANPDGKCLTRAGQGNRSGSAQGRARQRLRLACPRARAIEASVECVRRPGFQ